MKLRVLIGAAAAALLVTAVATAAPPPGKGKTGTTTTTASTKTAPCKANVAVVLTGTLTADGAAAPSSLTVTVTGGNNAGKAYKKATQPVSVAVTAKTKVVRSSASSKAEDMKSGDKVNIQAKACKASLKTATLPSLTATRVVAKPASS